ncbi:glutamine synthetase family protein [Kineosporia sp. R_H_3]|uniref:glutamine synthetase family protein n=1 Tax=Kineosporia sp. R_H_3 TaxID=1961848 RepID=UPI000B4B568C|nr:glutamine synthetase family protein [Kineosporia sp. R_H_3]
MSDVPPAPLSVEELRRLVASGSVDTVLVVFTDMQGRLQGKRVHAQFFLDDTLGHGTEGCNYLLAVDVDMNTVDGYSMSSWDTGYGDFVFRPDLSTLRPAPWLPGTVMVQCDLTWLDGSDVVQSPRQILLRQVKRAEAMGFVALAGTELEFMVFDDSYEQAWDKRYRDLTPSNRYNVDYSIIGTTRVEPLLRDIRNMMHRAGLVVESAKGECNYGQHEIAFKYAEVVTTADRHTVYKTAAKEIAANHGKALTFMSKVNEREGNSCHIHMSLRGLDGSIVFADPASPDGRSDLFKSFVAGVMAFLPDFSLLYAPNINSYKRFQPGSFAPTAVAWGEDNRTCALRVVGKGPALRVENRVPGGDVNPYLALAAMLGSGLQGIEQDMQLEPALVGNGYVAERTRVATTLRAARDAFSQSPTVKTILGASGPRRPGAELGDVAEELRVAEEVVRHYTNMADVELRAYEAAVTDWELVRGFERL